MKYISEILFYLSWPVLIVISYQSVKWLINKYEKKEAELIDSNNNSEL